MTRHALPYFAACAFPGKTYRRVNRDRDRVHYNPSTGDLYGIFIIAQTDQ